MPPDSDRSRTPEPTETAGQLGPLGGNFLTTLVRDQARARNRQSCADLGLLVVTATKGGRSTSMLAMALPLLGNARGSGSRAASALARHAS